MPPTQKNKKYKKCQNEHLQKLIILEGFSQNGLQIWIQRISLHVIVPVKIDFRHVFDYDFFVDIRIVKNYIKLMLWRLGTMLERFFEAKSFGLQISKTK